MELIAYVNQLLQYLDSADAVYLLGSKKDLFRATLKYLECEIENVDKPRSLPAEPNQAIQTLQFLQAVLIEQPVSPSGTRFIADYSLLVFNCNNNIFKNAQLDMLSMTVNRFCELRLTSLELIQQLRMVTNKLQQLGSLSFQPSVLSRHYLASFDTEQNNK